ncbi:hypothetical protein [Rosenbergiella metrosideri]|uniref:hypothetical protein n=1 Tax=Rosenbergiella metrosideri TaxID=2921185 RepID=UPI001F4F3962|nr:hypothetical protein [Rosenbergiella metrosideri]
MGALIKLTLKGLGLRGFMLMALVAVTAYLSAKGVSKYHEMTSAIATYAQNAEKDAAEKATLRDNIHAEKTRADAAESNSKLLADQMAHQQAEAKNYQDRLKALQDQKDKDDAATQKTLQRLNHELSLAGVHNVRVPDPVIRLQQQAICRVNGSCASSNRDKARHAATSNR